MKRAWALERYTWIHWGIEARHPTEHDYGAEMRGSLPLNTARRRYLPVDPSYMNDGIGTKFVEAGSELLH